MSWISPSICSSSGVMGTSLAIAPSPASALLSPLSSSLRSKPYLAELHAAIPIKPREGNEGRLGEEWGDDDEEKGGESERQLVVGICVAWPRARLRRPAGVLAGV
jgi:hypothetical protein